MYTVCMYVCVCELRRVYVYKGTEGFDHVHTSWRIESPRFSYYSGTEIQVPLALPPYPDPGSSQTWWPVGTITLLCVHGQIRGGLIELIACQLLCTCVCVPRPGKPACLHVTPASQRATMYGVTHLLLARATFAWAHVRVRHLHGEFLLCR